MDSHVYLCFLLSLLSSFQNFAINISYFALFLCELLGLKYCHLVEFEESAEGNADVQSSIFT